MRVFFPESKEEKQKNIDALFGRETLTFHITFYQHFATFSARFKSNINQLEWQSQYRTCRQVWNATKCNNSEAASNEYAMELLKLIAMRLKLRH